MSLDFHCFAFDVFEEQRGQEIGFGLIFRAKPVLDETSAGCVQAFSCSRRGELQRIVEVDAKEDVLELNRVSDLEVDMHDRPRLELSDDVHHARNPAVNGPPSQAAQILRFARQAIEVSLLLRPPRRKLFLSLVDED